MTVSPREQVSCNSFGAAGRSRTCIAPIKSRVLCLLSYDGTHYFPIREPRKRLRFCSAVAMSSPSDHPGAGSRNRTEGLRITGAALWPAKLSQRFFFVGLHPGSSGAAATTRTPLCQVQAGRSAC